ncbi:glycosyl hydrolase family 20 [Algoriphagus ratkowskyi]|uniref:beta-N-acetylhexosaminidase n=1 Tax=Algoriphagus ratkowskyi TaxID=57028 RepID=A0A2W7RRK3_9BACT|nr:family 20 glycosylhydrolase [Algoriphagus ratkowskyi]PZX53445.1 glycosyl hydrolase family 20 [Algoriphagus ratkowskyi]TXD76514.1 family 20 glycosylhydrolase [Algoriphagus ratkowskyi]
MRLFSLVGLLLIAVIFASCTTTPKKEGIFMILPSPSSVVISGISELSASDVEGLVDQAKSDYISGKALQESVDKSVTFTLDTSLDLKAEGYTLEISEDHIDISASSKEGLWYGVITLGQLVEDALDQDAAIPLISVKDEPALQYRAIQLDVKHHLEKKEYYYELMDRLADQKINGIILEIEDKLAFVKQPKVGSADAWSIAEWKELSEYAMARNIRISPLVQGLGHASFILKHEEYKDLRDDLTNDWAFNPLDERTYEVQFDLYSDALAAFPFAQYLHVGGDEVHTTGRGSGKSDLELQLTWLNRVSKYAEEHNVTPIFWDDMPLQNAGVYGSIFNRKLTEAQVDSIWTVNEPNLNKYVDLFPKNCIYMRWNYEMPETHGNNRAMKWFTDHGFQVMGATAGQTRWVLMPLEESNTANIRDFAKISIDNKAEGLLLTLWDDDSPHFELYQRGISIFAEYTWSGEKRSSEELNSAFRQRTFGSELAASDYAFINDLEAPVAFWKNALLDSRDRNRLKRMENPMQDAVLTLPEADSPGEWSERNKEKLAKARESQQMVDSVLVKIAASKKVALRNTYTLEVYEQVAKVTQFSNKSLLLLAEWDLAKTVEERDATKDKLLSLEGEWKSQMGELEKVYGKTRVLDKPAEYILDQDHHAHLANQAVKFSDWQFYVENLFIQKIKEGNSFEMTGDLKNK